MFCQVSNILSIKNIHFLNDSNVKDMNKMDYIFYYCSSLVDLYPPKWNSSIFKNNINTIYKCPFFKSYYDNVKVNLVNENICNIAESCESQNNSSKKYLSSDKFNKLLSHNNDEINDDNKKEKLIISKNFLTR